jgi:hypothetical protein
MIQEIIDSIKSQGFQVYAPEKLTAYCFFTDGIRIGYADFNRMEGVRFSTVHKPNSFTGTGFMAKDLHEALSLAPDWVSFRERAISSKYRDFADFHKSHWQPLLPY